MKEGLAMIVRIVSILGSIALAGGFTLASQPGEPLTMEDFVVVMPGITIERVAARVEGNPCAVSTFANPHCLYPGPVGRFADGTFLIPDEFTYPVGCGDDSCAHQEIWLVGPDSSTTVVAYLANRAAPGNRWDDGGLMSAGVDAFRGTAVIRLRTSSPSTVGGTPPYQAGQELLLMRGFVTLAEVVQTFAPQAGGLTYRVPALPEGLPAADHFDTYWGPLTRPFTFANAQPLQCGYPAAPPKPGDCLTVADTVPTPAVGEGVYYVTAATYQGQRRFGRKYMNGAFSGRDPSVLPACQ